jgi:hypothetical protein
LTLLKMQLASQRIRRVQFSVKKSVWDQFPIRTGSGRAHAVFGLDGGIMAMRIMSLSENISWLA